MMSKRSLDKDGHKYFDDLYGRIMNGVLLQPTAALVAMTPEEFTHQVTPHAEHAKRKFVAWEGREPNTSREMLALINYGALAIGLLRVVGTRRPDADIPNRITA
jgi:hypothetical protein